MPRPPLSLKGRALKLLSQREHSRLELARKLSPHTDDPEVLQALLDELEAAKWLSQERFAEHLAVSRGRRFGLQRVKHELAQHRLPVEATEGLLADLKATERTRALAVWQRRYHELPTDREARAKQQRFLQQRGFSGDAIAWVMRGAPED